MLLFLFLQCKLTEIVFIGGFRKALDRVGKKIYSFMDIIDKLGD